MIYFYMIILLYVMAHLIINEIINKTLFVRDEKMNIICRAVINCNN